MNTDDLLTPTEDAQRCPTDDAKFRHAVAETLRLRPNVDIDIATQLSVSRTTVHRWASGAATPHELMRAPVYRVLLRIITAEALQ